MYNEDLLRRIISGRCFLLLGAGVSTELGYPSWETLTRGVVARVLKDVASADKPTYDHFLAGHQYAEIMTQAERDLGSRLALVDCLKELLVPDPAKSSPTYELLAKWPFAVYLTTNYDDEMHQHLSAEGLHFAVLRNRQEHLAQIRHDSTSLIVKIHSDLDHPDEAIITSLDYHRASVDGAMEYLRSRLQAVFEMFDVLIIGHSLKDPDLQLILEAAQVNSDPTKPVYMTLANATQGVIREYAEKYNIRVIPYPVTDGSHHELRSILRTLGVFVPQRNYVRTYTSTLNEDRVDAATSLYLMRQATSAAKAAGAGSVLLPLILKTILAAPTPLRAGDLVLSKPLSLLAQARDLATTVLEVLPELVSQGLVVESPTGELALSDQGKARVSEAATERQTEEDQALGQFVLDLKKACPSFTADQLATVKNAFRNAMVTMLEQRGLDLARVVLAREAFSPRGLPNLFSALTSEASQFQDPEQRYAFVVCGKNFLVSPTPPQRKYLASLSQGFFLYQLAGLDPTFQNFRTQMFQQTVWFLDSSVFLPLLARGSLNHAYAVDLFAKLAGRGARVFTTDKMLEEAWAHLDWARRFVRSYPPMSMEFLAYTSRAPDNLFLDGFIRLNAEGKVSDFQDYVAKVFPEGTTREAMRALCQGHGMNVLSLSLIQGFSSADQNVLPNYVSEIKKARMERGTYRSASQVDAEAELLIIIQNLRSGRFQLSEVKAERVYFISQSRILDIASSNEPGVITWSPEAFYRYLNSLPGETPSAELLHECMLSDFFYAGVSFIDNARYVEFFSPVIAHAKISYEEQKEHYLKTVDDVYLREHLDEVFEKTPDLQKPFFITQMARSVARQAKQLEEMARAQADASEKKARSATKEAEKLRKQRDEAVKARRAAESELNRIRNLSNPKRQKKLAKRKKQRGKK
jgi:hypothetical protein